MSLDDRLRRRLHRVAEGIDPDVETHLARAVSRAERRGQASVGSLLLVAALAVGLIFVLRGAFGGPNTGPGGLPSTSAAPSVSASPSGFSYEQIAGAYTTTLGESDPVVRDEGMSGIWSMELRPDGTQLISPPATFRDGSRQLSGIAFSVVDSTFRTNAFVELCTSVGTYRWALSGDRLTFTPIDDECPIRLALMSSQPWAVAQ